MTNFSAQRAHMVQSQLMPSAVTDSRLLAAMSAVPREAFVPAERRAVAYSDRPVPLGGGRMLLDPMTLARLIQLAAIGDQDRVMIVGGATGYSAAIAARLAREVAMIDQSDELIAAATANLTALNIANASAQAVPHIEGLKHLAPFDAIIVEGRVRSVPKPLSDQLGDGGRLATILGENATAKALLMLRSDSVLGERLVFDAPAPALPGFDTKKPEFVF